MSSLLSKLDEKTASVITAIAKSDPYGAVSPDSLIMTIATSLSSGTMSIEETARVYGIDEGVISEIDRRIVRGEEDPKINSDRSDPAAESESKINLASVAAAAFAEKFGDDGEKIEKAKEVVMERKGKGSADIGVGGV